MDPVGGGTGVRSMSYGVNAVEIEVQGYQFNDELQRIMMVDEGPPQPGSGSSFTALLELPANQAMDLLHIGGAGAGAAPDSVRCHGSGHEIPYIHHHQRYHFPSDAAFIERAAKYSVFATSGSGGGGSGGPEIGGGGGGGGGGRYESPESISAPSNSGANPKKVKNEPAESSVIPRSVPQTPDPDPAGKSEKHMKRKEREKGKGSSKKSRTENSDDGEKLPYVHVRARRGQATDSHSLAERARREKINARMKLLQELVPGCNKISGTALVLDEIINHVQSLQRQVEVLSMRLTAVNPRIDFNLDSLFATGNGPIMDSSFSSMAVPLIWPEVQFNGDRQQCQQQWHMESLNQPFWSREGEHPNLITSENSLLTYDSSANSASLHSSRLKMEP